MNRQNTGLFILGALAIGLFLFTLTLQAIMSNPQFIIQSKLEFIDSDLKMIELVLTNVTYRIDLEHAPEQINENLAVYITLGNLSFFYELEEDIYLIETIWKYPKWIYIEDLDRCELNLEFRSISVSYTGQMARLYEGILEVNQGFEIVDYTSSVVVNNPL